MTLDVHGVRLPLGVMANVTYEDLAVPLEVGDLLVFFTDGVNEAMNEQNELFGIDRLNALVKTCAGHSAKEVVDLICNALDRFTQGAPPADDTTIIAVSVQPARTERTG